MPGRVCGRAFIVSLNPYALFRLILVTVIAVLYTGPLCAQVVDTICSARTPLQYVVDHHEGSVYHWDAGEGVIVEGINTHAIKVKWPERKGLYQLSVTEENLLGCLGEKMQTQVFIRQNEFVANYPSSACVNDSVQLSIKGGTFYLWENGYTQCDLKIKLLHDTVMKVIVTDTSCALRVDTLKLRIKAVSQPKAGIMADADEIYKDQLVNLRYTGDNSDKVVWDIEKANFRNTGSHGLNVRFVDTGQAYIRLVATNPLGCKDSSEKMIEVRGEQLFFPTGFSPNDDGLNDEFKPGGIGIKEFHMDIYNRWGEKVFQTDDIDKGWKAYFDGRPVPADVYIYQYEAVGFTGKRYAQTGTVTVIR